MFIARALATFLPSGMLLGSNQSMGANNNYAVIPNGAADTANYPGSTMSSNGVVAQSSGTTTLSASAGWSASLAGQGRIRITVNGTVVVTGALNPSSGTATSGIATAAITQSINAGDIVRIEWLYSVFTGTTITSANTFVRIMQA